MFGLDSDTPIRVPFGSSMALRVAQWINPTMENQQEGPNPWMRWPLITGLSAIGVYDLGPDGHLVVPGRPPRPGTLPALPGKGGDADERSRKSSNHSLASGTSAWRGSRSGGMNERSGGGGGGGGWFSSLFHKAGSRDNLNHGRSASKHSLSQRSNSALNEDGHATGGGAGGGSHLRTVTDASGNTTTTGSPSERAGPTGLVASPADSPAPASAAARAPKPSSPEHMATLGQWEFPDMPTIENTQLYNGLATLTDGNKRSKHYRDREQRTKTTLSTKHVHCFEFYDAHFDFQTISLKLPGMTMNLLKYWDGQPLR
jgi:hypothetical protein